MCNQKPNKKAIDIRNKNYKENRTKSISAFHIINCNVFNLAIPWLLSSAI
jgi:hypothetical protein